MIFPRSGSLGGESSELQLGGDAAAQVQLSTSRAGDQDINIDSLSIKVMKNPQKLLYGLILEPSMRLIS